MSSFFELLPLVARIPRNALLDRLRPPVIILAYHRVTRRNDDTHQLCISPENFKAQITFLKQNFPVLNIEDDRSKIRETSVIITFDDGYADNFHEALPLLEELQVPATFFVATGPVLSGKGFWWDDLSRAFLVGEYFPPAFELGEVRFPTCTQSERLIAHRTVHRLMMKRDEAGRSMILDHVLVWRGGAIPSGDADRPMTPDEVMQLSRNRFARVGAHTVNHSVLSALTPIAQREEIFGGRDQLESIIGRKLDLFSYPFGGKGDYTSGCIRLCREAGFKWATANFSGHVYPWTDPLQLPRYLVRDWNEDRFTKMIMRFKLL